MEKLGVVFDDEIVKTGSKDTQCPKCGAELKDFDPRQPQCPRCGTEPWEKKTTKKDAR